VLDERQVRAPHLVEVARLGFGGYRLISGSGLCLDQHLQRPVELVEQPPETIEPAHSIRLERALEAEGMGEDLHHPGICAPQHRGATWA